MDQNSSDQSVNDISIPVSVSVETPSIPEPTLTSTPTPSPVITDTVAVSTPNSVSNATSNTITSEYKDKKVYKELVQVTLEGLDTGKITVEQSKEIAQFVLDHLDAVNTQVELSTFLQELANKWSVFQSVSLKLQEEGFKDEKIKEVQENINQINNQ